MCKLSICIPTTELKYSNGVLMGPYMLGFLLKSIEKQTFKDYEIIIADHSTSDVILNECKKWMHLNLTYYRNTEHRGSAAANINFAIGKANGKYIKTILQDDYLYGEDSLKYLVDNIGDHKWIATGTYHCDENDTDNLYRPHSPHWGDPIEVLGGGNTISGPSVLTFKNDANYFDIDLCWLNDVEFYYRLFLKYGEPLLLPNPVIVTRLREEGVSNTLNNQIKIEERKYVLAKHSINGNSTNIENYPAMSKRIYKLKLRKNEKS